MELKEIKLEDLEAQSFIEEQCQAISSEVGDALAINALSGGVDSSVVSMLEQGLKPIFLAINGSRIFQ